MHLLLDCGIVLKADLDQSLKYDAHLIHDLVTSRIDSWQLAGGAGSLFLSQWLHGLIHDEAVYASPKPDVGASHCTTYQDRSAGDISVTRVSSLEIPVTSYVRHSLARLANTFHDHLHEMVPPEQRNKFLLRARLFHWDDAPAVKSGTSDLAIVSRSHPFDMSAGKAKITAEEAIQIAFSHTSSGIMEMKRRSSLTLYDIFCLMYALTWYDRVELRCTNTGQGEDTLKFTLTGVKEGQDGGEEQRLDLDSLLGAGIRKLLVQVSRLVAIRLLDPWNPWLYIYHLRGLPFLVFRADVLQLVEELVINNSTDLIVSNYDYNLLFSVEQSGNCILVGNPFARDYEDCQTKFQHDNVSQAVFKDLPHRAPPLESIPRQPEFGLDRVRPLEVMVALLDRAYDGTGGEAGVRACSEGDIEGAVWDGFGCEIRVNSSGGRGGSGLWGE